MIDRFGSWYNVTCDDCSEEIGPYDEFYDAVEGAKDEDWIYKDGDNLCPDCKNK